MTTPQILTPTALVTLTQPTIANANNLLEQSRRAKGNVTSQETYDAAIDLVKVANLQKTRAEEVLDKLVGPLVAHVKWIREQFKPIFEALEEAKTNAKGAALEWSQAEQKRRDEEAAAQRKLAEDQAIADAEAAAAAGDTQRAEALLTVAASTPQEDTSVRGRGGFTGASGGSKFVWKGEVASISAICAAVVAGDLPESIIKEISKSGMNAIADKRRVEGVFCGIKIFEKEDLNVR